MIPRAAAAKAEVERLTAAPPAIAAHSQSQAQTEAALAELTKLRDEHAKLQARADELARVAQDSSASQADYALLRQQLGQLDGSQRWCD